MSDELWSINHGDSGSVATCIGLRESVDERSDGWVVDSVAERCGVDNSGVLGNLTGVDSKFKCSFLCDIRIVLKHDEDFNLRLANK